MIDSLLFSINSVIPIFLLVLFGGIVRSKGLLPESFFTLANKFVFKVTLPITLFLDVVGGGRLQLGSKTVAYCVVFLLVELLLLLLTVPFLVKDRAKCGALIQGSYRSNVAIMGVPLIISLFGDSGSLAMATVMPVMVVLYNASAVTLLSIFAPDEKKQSPAQIAKRILKNILTNPLIIGIVAGMLFVLLPFDLPVFLSKSLGYLDGLTMPLALMTLGASFHLSQLKGRLGLAACATLLRCFIFPAIAVTGAILLGMRAEELGVVFVIFGSSTAVASFVMAESMSSDSVLAGQIVLLTTVTSAFSIFLGTTILKFFGFF